MDANEIIDALPGMEDGVSMVVTCSGGRNVVTFSAMTGVGRNFVRSTVIGDPSTGIVTAFADLQAKLQAAQQQ